MRKSKRAAAFTRVNTDSGSGLPLGRLQQANYRASVTRRERQKHRLTEANNAFRPRQFQLQLQFHPAIHLPWKISTAPPGPHFLLFESFSLLWFPPPSTLIPRKTTGIRVPHREKQEEEKRGMKAAAE